VHVHQQQLFNKLTYKAALFLTVFGFSLFFCASNADTYSPFAAAAQYHHLLTVSP
jgi:hypothetical protein